MFYYKFIVSFFFIIFAINCVKILFVLSEVFNECYDPLLLLLLLFAVWELFPTLSSMQHIG